MKNKILSIMLTLAMALSTMSMVTISASAEGKFDGWTEIVENVDGYKIKSGNYYLNSDVVVNVSVYDDAQATIDLNGHILCGTNNGAVISNSGNLTLIDSNPNAQHSGDYADFPAGGIITGVDATNKDGGGVKNFANAIFTMNGGTIYGNKLTAPMFGTARGAGVYNGGTFIMNNGAISNNSLQAGGLGSMAYGACVFNAQNAAFTMNGGTISNNTNNSQGGGVYSTSAVFTMNGGTICNNTASIGGGVYLYNNGTAIIGGNAVIKDNTASDETTASNLCIGGSNGTIAIGTGKDGNGGAVPTKDMMVGVTIGYGQSGIFATGAVPNDSKYFFSDLPQYGVRYTDADGGRLELTPEPTFYTSADSGYYADAPEVQSKEGIIAFTSEFTNLLTTYKDTAFGDNDSFGIAMFSTASDPSSVNKDNITTKLSKTEFDTLKEKDGYFFSFIKKINSDKFSNTAYAIPFAIINGKTYWGDIVSAKVNGDKWLGTTDNTPKDAE